MWLSASKCVKSYILLLDRQFVRKFNSSAKFCLHLLHLHNPRHVKQGHEVSFGFKCSFFTFGWRLLFTQSWQKAWWHDLKFIQMESLAVSFFWRQMWHLSFFLLTLKTVLELLSFLTVVTWLVCSFFNLNIRFLRLFIPFNTLCSITIELQGSTMIL